MFKSAAVTALLLQATNVACFTPNARVSNAPFNNYDYGYENYDTELDGYLDQLAPEAPAKFTSYMPQIATNPKPSTVASYLDNVGGYEPVEAAPEVYVEEAAPVAEYYDATPVSNSYEYTNTYTHTNDETQQTHTHTHHHLHTYTYNYEYDSVTIQDDQKVDVEVTVSGGAAAYAAPSYSAPVSSYAPSGGFAEPTGQASSAVTGGYLASLASNVMSSGGGNAMGNPHLSSIPVTGTPCSGGLTLGNSYLNAIPVTATPCSGYNNLENFASAMNAAAPMASSDYAAAFEAPAAPVEEVAVPDVPAPSAGGDYLSALGGSSYSAPMTSYAPSGSGTKVASGSNLGSSYLSQF